MLRKYTKNNKTVAIFLRCDAKNTWRRLKKIYPYLKKKENPSHRTMSLKCKNAEKACRGQADYSKCIKPYQKSCQGTLANQCEVKCLQQGVTCPIEISRCRSRCLDHIKKFKPYPNGVQANAVNWSAAFGFRQPAQSHRFHSHARNQSELCDVSWKPNTGYQYDQFDAMWDCPVNKPNSALPPPYGQRV